MASYAAKTKESYQNIIKEVISQIQEQNSQGNIEIDEQVLKILKQKWEDKLENIFSQNPNTVVKEDE